MRATRALLKWEVEGRQLPAVPMAEWSKALLFSSVKPKLLGSIPAAGNFFATFS